MTYCRACGLQSARHFCPACVVSLELAESDNPLHEGVSPEVEQAMLDAVDTESDDATPGALLLVCPVCTNSDESTGGQGFYVLESSLGETPDNIFESSTILTVELRVCRVCRYVFVFDRFGNAADAAGEPER